MAGEFDEDDMRTVFTQNQEEAYVTNISNAKLPLMTISEEDSPCRLDPEDAPLYLDLEDGEAVYHSEVPCSVAEEAARYAINHSGVETTIRLNEDDERWEEEFSDLVDQDIDLGKSRSEHVDAPVDGSPHRYLTSN